MDAVWNDCAVSENSLTRSIALLRRLLGDDIHEPRYIATVPTIGYRFLCDVKAAEDRLATQDADDLRQPDSGNRFESYRGTHAVQSSPRNQQVQTAVTVEVEEKVEQRSHEGRRQPRRLLLLGLIAAAFVTLVTGFLVYRAVSNRDTPGHGVQPANAAAASSRMRTVPLTSLPGWVRYPAFSPDAEKIAFIWNGENPIRGDVYVQLVGGERPLRLTHTDHGLVCCANWSPDEQKIAFGRCDDNGAGSSSFQRSVVRSANSPMWYVLSVTPDTQNGSLTENCYCLRTVARLMVQEAS